MDSKGTMKDAEEKGFYLWRKCKKLSTKELLKLLHNKEKDIRYAAARELQIRGEKRTFTEAVKLCESPKRALREIGAFILGQLAPPDFPFAKASISILTKLFQHDPDGNARASAGASLGHICDPEVIPILSQGVYDPEPEVRRSVAFALGCFEGKAEVVPSLLLLLKDDNNHVRNWAAFGLRYCQCDEPLMREKLLNAVEDSCEEVRQEAICALAEKQDSRVFSALESELKSEPVSYEIIEAVGNLQDVRLLARLEELREKWKDDVPGALTEAIAKIERIANVAEE